MLPIIDWRAVHLWILSSRERFLGTPDLASIVEFGWMKR